MVETPLPSEEDDQYWILASGSREEYYDVHNVLRPAETTKEDLPSADIEAVRELDLEAFRDDSPGSLTGKWNVFLEPDEIDEVWQSVVQLVEANEIYSAKVSSKYGREQENRDNHVIVVYTPNYFDTDDVFRVRELLRNECGIEETLYYKPDIYTRRGIYSDTAEEMGLPGASRYFD